MMKAFIILIYLITASFSQAQEKKEPISADRPDQTETPSIVPKGMFQLETGFVYEQTDRSSESITAPTMLWKYGMNENFELRLITEFTIDKTQMEKTSGLNPIKIGCKIKVCEEKGIIPKTSFIGHLSLPNAASSVYKTDFYAPQFRFAMQHSLSEKLSLSYNLGSEWEGFTAEPTFIYTLSAGYSVSEKWNSYIEIFGFAPQNDTASHQADGGLTYLISNDIMVDLSAGVGITANAPDYYIAVGCSFRI